MGWHGNRLYLACYLSHAQPGAASLSLDFSRGPADWDVLRSAVAECDFVDFIRGPVTSVGLNMNASKNLTHKYDLGRNFGCVKLAMPGTKLNQRNNFAELLLNKTNWNRAIQTRDAQEFLTHGLSALWVCLARTFGTALWAIAGLKMMPNLSASAALDGCNASPQEVLGHADHEQL